MPITPDPKPNTTRRVRLKNFDYRAPGYYFITICQQSRAHLFGSVDARGMKLNAAGDMIAASTQQIATKHANTDIDSFVVMPNHVHLLLGLNLSETTMEPDSVIHVMQWWKTVTTKRYIEGVKRFEWPRFNGKLWQEGYHDRIVRDQRELEYIRHYIEQNPMRWEEDTFYDAD